jgi:hypothetical protein
MRGDLEREREERMAATAARILAEIALALMAAGMTIDLAPTLVDGSLVRKGMIDRVDGVGIALRAYVMESWRSQKSRVTFAVGRERTRVYPINREGGINLAKLVEAVREDVAAAKKREVERNALNAWEDRVVALRTDACEPLRAYAEAEGCDDLTITGVLSGGADPRVEHFYVKISGSLDAAAVREIVRVLGRAKARRVAS